MRTVYTTPAIARTAGPAPQIDADLLMVQDERGRVLAESGVNSSQQCR